MAQREYSNDAENIDFKIIFESMPGNSMLLKANPPFYSIITVTQGYLKYSPFSKHELSGKGIFEVFPSNPQDKNDTGEFNLRASFARVMQYRREDLMEKQRYDVPDAEGQFEERFWRATNKPVINSEGNIYCIIHTVEEVTDIIKAGEAQAKVEEMAQMNNVFMQAPLAIHILKGPELIIEMANDRTLEMWGKTKAIIGKPISDVLPELLKKGYIEAISKVRETGKPIYAYERSVVIQERDLEEPGFYNFVIQPYYEPGNGDAEGVLIFVNDVTEKVRSQNALAASNVLVQQSEEQIRSLIESAPFPIGVYAGREMKIKLANQSILDVWGKGNEVIGKLYAEVLPELENQAIFEQLDNVFTTGISLHAKNRQVDIVTDGKQRSFYFNYSFTPLFNAAGEVYGVMNTAADVSDLNTAVRTAEESEHRYRMLIEESPVATAFYTGRELKLQYANDIMMGYWGKGNNVTGMNLSEILPELKGQPFLQLLDDVYTTGHAYVGNQEKVSLFVDGETRDYYYNFTYKPLHDKSGAIYGIHHIAIDVTGEVLVKKALEESKDQLQFAIEATELGTFDYNPANNKFSANARLKEWFGLKPENEIDLTDAINAIAEKDRQRVTEAIQKALDISSGGGYDIEYLIQAPGTEKEIYVRAKGRAWFDDEGRAYRFNGTLQDVTPQAIAKQKVEELVAERTEELAEANKNLQRSNAELAQFAYIASHDLQEPLRKISTYSQMLESSLGSDLSERSKNYFTKLHASSSRMLSLIRDVLAYSQLSTTHNLLEKVDLNQVVENVKTDFELLIEQKRATINTQDLPELEAIPLQMSQLFTNLISNALKFVGPDADPVINITAAKMTRAEVKALHTLDPDALYYRITFTDNGIGFEQEYAQKIFDIFQRLHLKTAYEGTGIGLALCRKIAQNHHGNIYAEGHRGKGATFHVILPEVQPEG